MSKTTPKVEYIVWQDKIKHNDYKDIHAVGFIIKETNSFVVMSLTKSYGKYIDLQKIPRKNIISRERLSFS